MKRRWSVWADLAYMSLLWVTLGVLLAISTALVWLLVALIEMALGVVS